MKKKQIKNIETFASFSIINIYYNNVYLKESEENVIKITKRHILSRLLNLFSHKLLPFVWVTGKCKTLIENIWTHEVRDMCIRVIHFIKCETSYHINPAGRDRYFSRVRSDKLVLLVRVSFDSSMSHRFSYFYLTSHQKCK